jgi:CRP-like cAMP-binding protein
MQLDDTATILAHAEFFEICDAEQRRLLAFASERISFAPNEVIYQSGTVADGAHVLIRGMVSTVPDDKAEKPYRTSQHGTLLGSMALVLPKPRPVTISAVDAVETLLVPRSAFMKLARQFPDLAQRAVARIQSEMTSYIDAIEKVRTRMERN